MLYEQVGQLFESLRLEHYRALFGRIRESAGPLSATEAYAADVVYLLEAPTISAFAETLGISQPNATYKINNLAAKGYVTRAASDEDRRECRVSVSDRFHEYYDTSYPFLREGVEKLARDYTPEEMALFGKMLGDLNGYLTEA